MVDDFNAPLGQDSRRTRGFGRLAANAFAGALGLAVATFAGWALFVDDPFGGEPTAIVSAGAPKPDSPPAGAQSAEPGREQAQAAATPLKPSERAAEPPPAGRQTVTIIDGSSGRREQVTVGQDEGLPAGVPAPSGPRITVTERKAPEARPAFDQRLAEASRHGTIPKVAADGTRAADLYARPPEKSALAGTAPRVAIVVGRLGIGAAATGEALAKLPAAVTLAFPPYATDLDRWVAKARGEGRELLLQVPMEPFDFPDNDSGPQTLLTSLPAEQNLDRLHWAMSRFQGYVGIGNFMGGRFVASEPAVGAVVREAGKRGLIYFDDGTAARSSAGAAATGSNVPFVRADLVLDAAPTPAEIDAALAKLEALARERGVAVGSAGALPVSIERIGRWAKAAASRGIVLVPVSAIANKAKQS